MAFDKNKDYAAAIKNEKDPAKKQQLASEREEKIKWQQSQGNNKYSNDVYKGQSWYKPSSGSSGGGGSSSGSTGSSSSSGYFQKDLDYAAAIAKANAEKNTALANQLIEERQNKIDWLNATGQNKYGASNAIYGNMKKDVNSGISQNYKDYTEGITMGQTAYDTVRQSIDSIIRAMEANSAMWNSASDSDKLVLAQQNQDYANQLRRLGVNTAQLKDGRWYYLSKPFNSSDIHAEDDGTGYYRLYDMELTSANDTWKPGDGLISPRDNIYFQEMLNGGALSNYYFGGMGDGTGGMDSIMEQFMSMYDPLVEARNAQLELALAEIEGQRGQNNEQYDDIARQAYIAKRQGETALPQRLAAYGISGGGSETADLSLQTNYQNNLYANEKARQQMMELMDQNALYANAQAQSDISNILAQAQQQAYQAYQQERAYQLQQEQFRQQMEWEQYQYENNLKLSQADSDWARQQYEIELALQMGDYSKLASMGYNTSYLQKLQDYELADLAAQALKASTSSRSSGSSRSSSGSSSGGSTGSGTSSSSDVNKEWALLQALRIQSATLPEMARKNYFETAAQKLLLNGQVSANVYNAFNQAL